MIFYARLKKNSSIHTEWKNNGRLSGTIDGILFRLVKFEYVSDELTMAEVNKITGRIDQQIQLEGIVLQPRALRRPRLKKEAEEHA
jgi:hypothetical protein